MELVGAAATHYPTILSVLRFLSRVQKLYFYIYKRAVFTLYMTISKDALTPDRIHLEQVRNWYRQALHLYGTWQIRSRSVSYLVPNGFTNDNPVWNCTKWNRTARNSCKRSLKVTSNTGIVNYIQGRLERMGRV